MPGISEVHELIESKDYEKAESLLASVKPNGGEDQADAEFCRGVVYQQTNRWEDAINAFKSALDADGHHVDAAFHLAYLLDLRGDDETAADLYRKCIEEVPAPVAALTNLAVHYEELGRFDDAADCLDRVIEEHPDNQRARAFLRDVESSLTMYYDEDQERVREKHSALLDIPVTDFELSVRSRNCLKQMNINSLGDLLRVSETQLMAYKNFGETSLSEIKAMLKQKGLRLGQMVENPEEEAPSMPTVGDTGIYARSVAELELSVRSRKCLQRLGINTLGELAARSEPELLAIKNFGQTSLNEIKRRMEEMGLSLRQP